MSQKSLCSRGRCEQDLRAAEMERAHRRSGGAESPTIVPADCPADATANSVAGAVIADISEYHCCASAYTAIPSTQLQLKNTQVTNRKQGIRKPIDQSI
jgi:hypothetical protein